MLNPYAKFLDGRDPLEVVVATGKRLYDSSATLGLTGIEWRPQPSKWNAREIISHLADCEIVFGYRLQQTLAEPHHVIQPFDQERWAGTYGSRDVRIALEVFSSVRDWNVLLIRSLPSAALAKKVTHPERGEMTFQTIVETMAGHDLNHLLQLEAIVSSLART